LTVTHNRDIGDRAPGLSISALRPPAELQAGGRAPAPGTLAVVQSFVNTARDLRHGEEQLDSAAAVTGWLVGHGLLGPGTVLGEDALERTLDVRQGLRAMLFANNDCPYAEPAIERLNRALRGPGVSAQLRLEGAPDFATDEPGLDGALGLLGMLVAVAQLDGSWARLKACPGPECGWVFYDASRNLTGHWCSMSICGSRAKAREYRRRHVRTTGSG
jgi:hypothetical protein